MKKLENGARVYANIGGKKEPGILLDSAWSSAGDYSQCKVELLKENPLTPGQLLRGVYPHPIQSYKLTRRYDVLPGEVQTCQ
jgi:hypothetical protein